MLFNLSRALHRSISAFQKFKVMSLQSLENSSEMPENTASQEKCKSWNKYSESKLIELEQKIFKVLKTAYNGKHVPIEQNSTEKSKIWTISMNTESKNTPLVLLHGFAAGVGFWCLNLDSLAANRPLYAIDLLGFGRSSRPDFSNDALDAEKDFVESIEKWRKEMGLEKFVLLGHSMGGYLATSYTISHPDRVKHLILADPWGFVEKPADFNPPLWVKTLAVVFWPLLVLNPLATVRAAGPLGPWIVRKMRSDIANKYAGRIEDHEIISDYIYQCNSQKPTGETAFHRMIKSFAFAKHPMLNRIDQLRSDVPITVMMGDHTWMDKSIPQKLRDLRQGSYVKSEIVNGAGHHIHADNPEHFNEIVADVCNFAERAQDVAFPIQPKHPEVTAENSDLLSSDTQVVSS